MNKVKYIKLTAIYGLAAVGFIACQSNDNTDKDTRLSYQFSVNDCAENERFELYNAKCDSGKIAKNEMTENESENSLPQHLRSIPNTDGPNEGKKNNSDKSQPLQPSPDISSASTLSKLILTVHPETQLRVQPQASNDVLLSTLAGKLVVDSVEPKFEKVIHLGRAETTTFLNHDLGQCTLLVTIFDKATPGNAIEFSLTGSDSKGQMEGSGCLARLSTLAMAGFTVEFTNVPVGGPLSNQVIPSVILKVETK